MRKVQRKTSGKRLVTEEYLDQRLDQFHQNIDKRFENIDKRFEKHEQATQEYLDLRLGEFQEEVRGETVKILQGVDKIITRFDVAEKDRAAHSMLHTHITDELHGHDQRIKKLEAKL